MEGLCKGPVSTPGAPAAQLPVMERTAPRLAALSSGTCSPGRPDRDLVPPAQSRREVAFGPAAVVVASAEGAGAAGAAAGLP